MSNNENSRKNRTPLFNPEGAMLERAGWSSKSNGKLVQCDKCGKDTLFLHQYEKYNENYCCLTCLDFFFTK